MHYRHFIPKAWLCDAEIITRCAYGQPLTAGDKYRGVAKSKVSCVVEKRWDCYLNPIENHPKSGGRSFLYDDVFREVYVVGGGNSSSNPKTMNDIVLFRPEHLAVNIWLSEDGFPTVLRLAGRGSE